MSLSEPEKSSIGLMSRKASARPLSRNHWKESRCTEIKSGSGRTSSRFANEKRSRVTGRDGKDYSLEDAVAAERAPTCRPKNQGRGKRGHGNWSVYRIPYGRGKLMHRSLVALTDQGKPGRPPGQALPRRRPTVGDDLPAVSGARERAGRDGPSGLAAT